MAASTAEIKAHLEKLIKELRDAGSNELADYYQSILDRL